MNPQQLMMEFIRIGVPSLCFVAIVWLSLRTWLLKIELDGPGFTMREEKASVADMLSDLLSDVQNLSREDRDLFVKILNRISRQGLVKVEDLFPTFHLDTEEHKMLQSLQCAHLIRPKRGGWDREAVIEVTIFGDRLAKARPNLFAASGTAFVT